MSNLIFVVYLVDLFDTLSVLTRILFIFMVPISLCMGLYLLLNTSDYYEEERTSVKNAYNSKIFKTLWVICLLGLFIPSKPTMHTMLGLYVGNEVVTEVTKSPLYEKAYKLLEKTIDEQLQEEDKK